MRRYASEPYSRQLNVVKLASIGQARARRGWLNSASRAGKTSYSGMISAGSKATILRDVAPGHGCFHQPAKRRISFACRIQMIACREAWAFSAGTMPTP